MEKYENLGLVGEGSYGMVLKCRHKETGQQILLMNESIVSIEDSLKLLIQMYVNYLPFLEPARQYNGSLHTFVSGALVNLQLKQCFHSLIKFKQIILDKLEYF
jgi:hypothetical protein